MVTRIIELQLLENMKNTTLLFAQKEFSELTNDLDGVEDITEIADYFFDKGFQRLSSNNEKEMEDIVWTMSQTFFALINIFRTHINYRPAHETKEVHDDGNITLQMGQLLRFINFIKSLEYIDLKGEDIRTFNDNKRSIIDFIFNNKTYHRPYTSWAEEFNDFEYYSKKDHYGYEPYYVSAIVEIMRTICNKKRHSTAYNKHFRTSFDFYYDFHQLVGIYNIAMYSFIELLEGWTSIIPYIKKNNWHSL